MAHTYRVCGYSGAAGFDQLAAHTENTTKCEQAQKDRKSEVGAWPYGGWVDDAHQDEC